MKKLAVWFDYCPYLQANKMQFFLNQILIFCIIRVVQVPHIQFDKFRVLQDWKVYLLMKSTEAEKKLIFRSQRKFDILQFKIPISFKYGHCISQPSNESRTCFVRCTESPPFARRNSWRDPVFSVYETFSFFRFFEKCLIFSKFVWKIICQDSKRFFSMIL